VQEAEDETEDWVDTAETPAVDAANSEDQHYDMKEEQEDEDEPVAFLEFVDENDFVLVETGAEARAQARAKVRAQRAAAAREVIQRFQMGANQHQQQHQQQQEQRQQHRRGFWGKVGGALKKGAKAALNVGKKLLGMTGHHHQPQPQPPQPVLAADGFPAGEVKPLKPQDLVKAGSESENEIFQQPPTRVPPFVPHPVDTKEQRTQKSWKTKRERFDDFWEWQPTAHRYSTLYNLPGKAVQRAKERFEEQQIQAVVYKVVENICTRHMPKAYYQICGGLMRRFRKIARLLQWKNRPEATCMHINFCNIRSYVQTSPHSSFN